MKNHDDWIVECLDVPVLDLWPCMCGEPVSPGHACDGCGYGDVWIGSVDTENEESDACETQSS